MKEPSQISRTRWIQPDQEWLEYQHFILGKPYKQVATEIGCCKETVQSWARKLKVSVEHLFSEGEIHPPVKVGIGSGIRCYGWSKEWLGQQYVEQDKSAKQIADELGIAHVSVVGQLRKFGIPLRDRQEMNRRHAKRMSGKGNPAYTEGKSQRYQHNKLKRTGRPQVCTWCGTIDDIQLHHIDHDRSNADLENLTWLCGPCNRVESYIWKLQEKGRVLVKQEGRTLTITYVT